MNCPKCGNMMMGGAPHCETIKVQMECHSCGHIVNEYYNKEELKINQLTAATGASLKSCREALEMNNYDLNAAERYLENKSSADHSVHPRHYYQNPADFERDEDFGWNN